MPRAAIVESGNLCGSATIFFALLRRALCPRCPFFSRDPGLSRVLQGDTMTCAQDAVAMAGLASEVQLADTIGAAVHTELPVGFVFLDDGKARYANAPLMSSLDEKMMAGAVVALDDSWQAEPYPHSNGHWGQIVFAQELLLGGAYKGLALPQPELGRWGLGYAKFKGYKQPLKPPGYDAMSKLHLEAPLPAAFGDNKKITVLQRAAAASDPAASGRAVRISLTRDADRREVAVGSAHVPRHGGGKAHGDAAA